MLHPTYIIQSYHWPFWIRFTALQWRHDERDSVSNHQPHDCLLNRLFRHISKKTSKLRVTGLCAGNSLVTGEFPEQRASNAENVSIWWRHHGKYLSRYICVDFCENSHTRHLSRLCCWIILRNKITCMRCHHLPKIQLIDRHPDRYCVTWYLYRSIPGRVVVILSHQRGASIAFTFTCTDDSWADFVPFVYTSWRAIVVMPTIIYWIILQRQISI